MSTPLFWRNHLIFPLGIFAILVSIIELSNFDLILADWLYSLEGMQWSLQDHFITSTLLHVMGQHLSRIIGAGLLLLAIGSHFSSRLEPYKKGLWMLFLTLAAGSLIVSIAKAITHVDCPWDLQRYGGERLYLPIFQAHPGNYEYGRCFPSGHASGGYGPIGLYFFLLHYRPQYKGYGLALGIGMGLIYGGAQQLRGAHFLSHDLWSLCVCWLTALFMYWVFFLRAVKWRGCC